MTAQVKDQWRVKVTETKTTGITTKYYGTRKFQDLETGEIVEMDYAEKKVSHIMPRGWRRVYLENFMEIMTGLYSQGKKIKVLEFLLENLNSENQFTQTQSYVAKHTKISVAIVNQTFQFLVENDFMRKDGTAYVVNPKYVAAFGSDRKNATIAVKFSQSEPTLFDEN